MMNIETTALAVLFVLLVITGGVARYEMHRADAASIGFKAATAQIQATQKENQEHAKIEQKVLEMSPAAVDRAIDKWVRR